MSLLICRYFFASWRRFRLNSGAYSIGTGCGSASFGINVIPKCRYGIRVSMLCFMPSLAQTYSGGFESDALSEGTHKLKHEGQVLIRHPIQFGENLLSVFGRWYHCSPFLQARINRSELLQYTVPQYYKRRHRQRHPCAGGQSDRSG